MTLIKPRERDALVNSLRAGVVPRIGQHLIQVGRFGELETLTKDIEHISQSGTIFRLVIGEYGSGKTFFLNLVRAIGLEKKMVVANVDLTPDRRMQATGGQARALYAELMHNLSTRTKPDGGALPGIVEKFVSAAVQESKASGLGPDAIIHKRLERLSELVGGTISLPSLPVIGRVLKVEMTNSRRMQSDGFEVNIRPRQMPVRLSASGQSLMTKISMIN